MAGRVRQAMDDDLEENHEINVTPFIDVILVLLIIFMVARAAGHGGCQCRPAGVDRDAGTQARDAIVPDAEGDLTLAIGNDSVPRQAFAATLTAGPRATSRPASSCAPTRRSTMAT